jgi:hypothetical protein
VRGQMVLDLPREMTRRSELWEERRAERAAVRAEVDERRRYGLDARHAAKLIRLERSRFTASGDATTGSVSAVVHGITAGAMPSRSSFRRPKDAVCVASGALPARPTDATHVASTTHPARPTEAAHTASSTTGPAQQTEAAHVASTTAPARTTDAAHAVSTTRPAHQTEAAHVASTTHPAQPTDAAHISSTTRAARPTDAGEAVGTPAPSSALAAEAASRATVASPGRTARRHGPATESAAQATTAIQDHTSSQPETVIRTNSATQADTTGAANAATEEGPGAEVGAAREPHVAGDRITAVEGAATADNTPAGGSDRARSIAGPLRTGPPRTPTACPDPTATRRGPPVSAAAIHRRGSPTRSWTR